MPDGLDAMRDAIKRRRVEPSRHPRKTEESAPQLETPPPPFESAPLQAPVSTPGSRDPQPARRHQPRPAPEPAPPAFSRLNTAWVRSEQAQWLRELRAAALVDGVSISSSDVVRLALEYLRRRGGWRELRPELLAEYRSRASRKPRS